MAVNHFLKNINLRVLGANPFPPNKKRAGAGRNKLVTKEESELGGARCIARLSTEGRAFPPE
eukprot:5047908-Pyramimonas_sp.AAC.1